MKIRLGALAVQFGCVLHGDPEVEVSSVATLGGGPESLGFVANAAYRVHLSGSRLAAVVVTPDLAGACPVAALVHANPHVTFARIAALLHPAAPVVAGTHASASVDASARVDATAEIGPYVVIGAGAVVGPRARIGAHCTVGEGAVIGADSRLLERVSVLHGVRIGARCILHPGVVVGSDGFGNAREAGRWVKVPQLGGVRVGDDVEIGANTTIDRGALVDTEIEDGVRLDNLVHVAHNVTIGAHTAIAASTAIAGSVRIGQRCQIGCGVTILGQLSIGDDIVLAGSAVVTRSLDAPGMYSSVFPVEEVHVWRRLVGRFRRVESLVDRVRRLEEASSSAATGQNKRQDHDS